MPMDKAHLTPAERITVWLYPSFCLFLGLPLILTPSADLLHTPAFRTAARVMPLHTWGGMLLIVAAALLAAKMFNRVEGYVGALGLLFAMMATWLVIFALGAWRGDNPWTAAAFVYLAAGACVASICGFLAKVSRG